MKINIQTLGCPKNYNDSQMVSGSLELHNNIIVNSPEDADLIMVNTCGFINDAKKESIDRILEMIEYKADGKKILVSGCLSKRYSKELMEEIPEIDGIIGVNEYNDIQDIINKIFADEKPNIVSECSETQLLSGPRRLEDNPYSSTLKIAEGCNNRCAYCIIPGIRGPFRSKSIEDIVAEAEYLAAEGCKELILIAQDLTYYGKDLYGKYMLPELLRKLCRIEKLQWIRLMYCYEHRITEELIDVIATEDKICKYLDIPLQHGSNNILKAMRRHSTRESIEATISRLRERIPGIHIRTTLIVGFPGETDEDFESLLNFVEHNRFDRLGVFCYSQEENTLAGEMENQIDEDIKQERLDVIMRTQMEISLEKNQNKIGKTLKVIVDYKDDEGVYVGRTEFDAPDIDNTVIFKTYVNHEPGDIVKVYIEDGYDYDLMGMEVPE